MTATPGRVRFADGVAKPSTLPFFACAAYSGKRISPWLLIPSASASTSAFATARAFSALVRLRTKAFATSSTASARASVPMIALSAAIKLGQHEFAMAERFRRRQPSVRSARDHIDQHVAGLGDCDLAADDARDVKIDVLRHGARGLGISAELDHGKDRIADDVALAGWEAVYDI